MSVIQAYSIKDLASPMDSLILSLSEIIPKENILFWHDASDDSTMDLVSGAIYRRLDKSGHNNHLYQDSVSYRPTHVGAYDFYQGTGKAMIINNGIYLNIATPPIFYVLLSRTGYSGTTTPIVTNWASNYGWKLYLASRLYLHINNGAVDSGVTASTFDAVQIVNILPTKGTLFSKSTSGGSDILKELAKTITPVNTNFKVAGFVNTSQYLRFYEHFAIIGDISQELKDKAVSYVCNKWKDILSLQWYQDSIAADNPYKLYPPKSNIPAIYPGMIDGEQGSVSGDLSFDPNPIIAQDEALSTYDIVMKTGNVLSNDMPMAGLTVESVSGQSSNIGVPIAGNNGGLFTISSNGDYIFDPTGLNLENQITTGVCYSVTNGVYSRPASMSVVVSPAPSSWTDEDLWTAADIIHPIAAWFDGDDSTKRTLDGSSVTAWQDKGTLGYSLEGLAGNYPLLKNDTVTGKDFFRFENAALFKKSYYQVAEMLQNKQTLVAAVVCRNIGDASATAYDTRSILMIEPLYYSQSGDDIPYITIDNSPGSTRKLNFYVKFDGNASPTYVEVSGIDAEESLFQVYIFVADIPGSTARLRIFKNGNLIQTINSVSSTTKTTINRYGEQGSIAVGGLASYNTPPVISKMCRLDIAEIIVVGGYDAAGLTDLYERIDGYLAHKWTDRSLYPSTHPYKILPPFKE